MGGKKTNKQIGISAPTWLKDVSRISDKDESISSCGSMRTDKETTTPFDYHFYSQDSLLCVTEIRLSNKINMTLYSDNSLMLG